MMLWRLHILQWRRAEPIFEVSFGDSQNSVGFPTSKMHYSRDIEKKKSSRRVQPKKCPNEVYDSGLRAKTSEAEHGCG